MPGALCVPAAAATITASNAETRMRPPRFMRKNRQSIEVANLDFIRIFSPCRLCRSQRHPKRAHSVLSQNLLHLELLYVTKRLYCSFRLTGQYAAKNQCLQEK